MIDSAKHLGASKSATSLLVLFIPSKDRNSQVINQNYWVDECLKVLGDLFGGATAYPRGRGVWKDSARGGCLVYDEPVVIHCYTSENLIDTCADQLREFLLRMGKGSKQGAVGCVIDDDYLEIDFPIEE